VNFGKYLKSAFLNRWNLLCFLGASGFALLSGRADIFLPLVIAGEVLYVGLLGTHPKFQRYIEAQAAKALRPLETAKVEENLSRILSTLPRHAIDRFEALRRSCLELRQLAQEIKDPAQVGVSAPLDSLQMQGLDRLLWVFLRLLFTQHSLSRFLDKTSAESIRGEIGRLEERLKKLDPRAEDLQSQKVRKALEDNLETCKARLENHEKAKANSEVVGLEIDRLENKIRSLSEIGVNRHEPDFIASQVDEVATSMLSTEKTMSELAFATGFDAADDAVPELLRRERAVAKE
jgi:hypothetical protein